MNALRSTYPAVAFALIILASGCGSNPGSSGGGSSPSGAGRPFLDEKKSVGPGLEWNRELVSRRGGTFSFRVTSQGPFTVSVVTDKGYKALFGKDPKAFNKADVLLTLNSKETTYEGKVTVPAGSSWFIIKNQTATTVELHLQCVE